MVMLPPNTKAGEVEQRHEEGAMASGTEGGGEQSFSVTAVDAVATGVRRVRFDLGQRPFLVLLELTGACALACAHCRAEAVAERDPRELRTDEVTAVLEDLAALGSPRPHVVFTGGDPLRRPDLDELVARAAELHLAVGVSPAGTELASAGRLARLRRAGAGAVSFSLDGATPGGHDGFRRVTGSFAWTVAGCRAAREAGLRLQVNSTVCVETLLELPGLLRLVHDLGVNLWSVFFLVPVGRGRLLSPLSATETEDVLAFLSEVSRLVPLKTTEAPAYRRIVQETSAGRPPRTGELYQRLWRQMRELWPEGAARVASAGPHSDAARRAPLAVGDGRGVVFVSRTGVVQPSGFLPLAAGSVRETPLTTIYRESPLLRSLRDPSSLRGRCGACGYAETCGGSRALAFAHSGDPLGADPSCRYDPAGSAPLAHLSA